jgi:Arc/MetJ-type ribon-helix-helix transcriptional regulator
MSGKIRLSATIDEDAVGAARQAVEAGRAESVSAWVNEAMVRFAEHERRLVALDEFLAAYEDENGEITDDEMSAAKRRVAARATVVRGRAAG